MNAARLFDLPVSRAPRRTDAPRRKSAVPLLGWLLDAGLNVVLFSAMGGSCDGLEMAGLPVHIAINHDPVAVAVHRHRHPHTHHFQNDVFDVDPREATGGRPVNVLWASPDCRHFSRAKGAAPVSKRVRSLAWIICRWAAAVRPTVIFVENVREIRTWGPLVARRDKTTGRVLKIDGTVAAPGERVPLGDQQLVPDPARKGRTFRRLIANIRSQGYEWDDRDLCCADFGVPTSRTRFFGVARRDGFPIMWPERTHAPKDHSDVLSGKLAPWVAASTIIDWSAPMSSIFGRKKPLAEATLRRTARGIGRYVLDNPTPFLVPVTHTGNRVGPVVDQPLPTVTTARGGEWAIVAPHVSLHRGESAGISVDDPMPTMTANSFHKRPGGCMPVGVVGTALSPYYGERREGEARGSDLNTPIPAVTTGNRFAVIGAHMREDRGRSVGQSVDEPLSTVTQAAHHAVVETAFAPSIMVNNGDNVGIDVGTPLRTMTSGNRHHVVAPMLVKNHSGVVGQAVDAAIGTVTTTDHHSIAAAVLTDRDMPRNDRAIEAAAFIQHYYGSGGQDQSLTDPLHAVTTKARHGLVVVEIDGRPMVVVDILFRMLRWYEAAAAHGFARDCIPDEVEIDGKVTRLSQDRKMAFVGNSVPPRMAMLLAQANHAHVLQSPGRRAVG